MISGAYRSAPDTAGEIAAHNSDTPGRRLQPEEADPPPARKPAVRPPPGSRRTCLSSLVGSGGSQVGSERRRRAPATVSLTLADSHRR